MAALVWSLAWMLIALVFTVVFFAVVAALVILIGTLRRFHRAGARRVRDMGAREAADERETQEWLRICAGLRDVDEAAS